MGQSWALFGSLEFNGPLREWLDDPLNLVDEGLWVFVSYCVLNWNVSICLSCFLSTSWIKSELFNHFFMVYVSPGLGILFFHWEFGYFMYPTESEHFYGEEIDNNIHETCFFFFWWWGGGVGGTLRDSMGHGLQVLVELLRVTISMIAKIWVLVRDCLTKVKLRLISL